MIDLGSGPPVVLIPGIQGRCEWMRPAIDALAARTRVISFSLPGEPGSQALFDARDGFDLFAAQIDAALDRANVKMGTICGVSFGGLIAVRYAASRPERTCALVLVSAPSPTWCPSAQMRSCMRHPWLLSPLFFLGASRRAWQEMSHTFPHWRQRITAVARYGGLVIAAPTSPARMSRRAALAIGLAVKEDCSRITAPTLVVTGESGLDQVVPTATTLEYTRLIRRTRAAELERTGHLGIITRPDRFAALVAGFAIEHGDGQREPRRTVS